MPTLASSKKIPQCALICVGSELLRGKINTHTSTLSRRLASIGLTLMEERTYSDDPSVLSEAIRHTLEKRDVVFVTGGLGPTFDDLSREAAAEATGRSLLFSEKIFKKIVSKFHRARYRHMPPSNRRQAYLIDGARAIENTVGTAPGQWLDIGPKSIVLLPGPPSELIPMLDRVVLPLLQKRFPSRPRVEAHLHFVGVPESRVDQKVRPVIDRASKVKGVDVQFTILAHLGQVDFDIFLSSDRRAQAERVLRDIVNRISKALANYLYGTNDAYPLGKVVGTHFRDKKMTLSVAESCTGGLLSSRLTDISGSSDYYLGGIISYSNEVKAEVLGVSRDLLKRYGAVSEPVARAMAENVRRLTGSSWALSVTGIAGPSGGTPKKPLGLVYVGLAGPRGSSVAQYHMNGSRDAIRQRIVMTALDTLRRI